MDRDLYWKRLNYAEEVLTPLFRAKYQNWDAQSVVDLLAHLFSLAEKNNWHQHSSELVNGVPFFRYYSNRIGQRIWRNTLTLANGPWTESKFEKLNFHNWSKPEVPPMLLARQSEKLGKFEISRDPQSPLKGANNISRSERLKNRRIWNSLFRDIMLLNKRPGAEIYEHHPYSTYVFRFGKDLFLKHFQQAAVSGIDHPEFCEYILRPLYFSAMYEVRSLVPYRVSGRQYKKAVSENGRVEILPLLDLCRHCLRPLKRSTGARKARSDARFCAGNTCKNAYHRLKKSTQK